MDRFGWSGAWPGLYHHQNRQMRARLMWSKLEQVHFFVAKRTIVKEEIPAGTKLEEYQEGLIIDLMGQTHVMKEEEMTNRRAIGPISHVFFIIEVPYCHEFQCHESQRGKSGKCSSMTKQLLNGLDGCYLRYDSYINFSNQSLNPQDISLCQTKYFSGCFLGSVSSRNVVVYGLVHCWKIVTGSYVAKIVTRIA